MNSVQQNRQSMFRQDGRRSAEWPYETRTKSGTAESSAQAMHTKHLCMSQTHTLSEQKRASGKGQTNIRHVFDRPPTGSLTSQNRLIW